SPSCRATGRSRPSAPNGATTRSSRTGCSRAGDSPVARSWVNLSPARDNPRPTAEAVVRALLVEDEALVAMVAEEALSALGFKPTSARTTREAMAEFEAQEPELALIDVGLPDGKGDD